MRPYPTLPRRFVQQPEEVPIARVNLLNAYRLLKNFANHSRRLAASVVENIPLEMLTERDLDPESGHGPFAKPFNFAELPFQGDFVGFAAATAIDVASAGQTAQKEIYLPVILARVIVGRHEPAALASDNPKHDFLRVRAIERQVIVRILRFPVGFVAEAAVLNP